MGEIIVLIIGTYMALGLVAYGYAVVKTYEILGQWHFNIQNGFVGLFPYPKWLIGWLEHIVDIVGGRK
jgi:hypothetical protein